MFRRTLLFFPSMESLQDGVLCALLHFFFFVLLITKRQGGKGSTVTRNG